MTKTKSSGIRRLNCVLIPKITSGKTNVRLEVHHLFAVLATDIDLLHEFANFQGQLLNIVIKSLFYWIFRLL
jgi:hypothetical protein